MCNIVAGTQWFSSYTLKYAQDGALERDCGVYFRSKLSSHSLHAVLNRRRKISDSIAFICIHPIIFELCMMKKKERKEERKKEKKKEEEQNGYFYRRFSQLRETLAEAWEHFLH